MQKYGEKLTISGEDPVTAAPFRSFLGENTYDGNHERRQAVGDRSLLSGLFYQRNGHPDLRSHPAKPDRREKPELYGGGRSAVVPGDRKLMFQPGLPGILRDDVPEDGCRGPRDPVSGLPAFIYIRTSGPGSLCDDLSHRYYKGNDHDHQ